MSERLVRSAGDRPCGDGDGIDVEPVRAALRRLGFAADGQLSPEERPALVALLAKAEAGTSGRLRGRRHTMLDDSDISSTRHARAFVAGALGGARRPCRASSSRAAPSIRARMAAGPSPSSPIAAILPALVSSRRPAVMSAFAAPTATPRRAVELETIGMTKIFGPLVALEDVSIHVRPGTLHALLGENGAGKSTLVKCIMGFYQPTRGSVMVDGKRGRDRDAARCPCPRHRHGLPAFHAGALADGRGEPRHLAAPIRRR